MGREPAWIQAETRVATVNSGCNTEQGVRPKTDACRTCSALP